MSDSTPFLWMQEDEGEAVADCGCRLYFREASPCVDLCPLHQEAAALRDSLRECLRALRAHISEAVTLTGAANPETYCPCTGDEVKRAQALLDLVDGRGKKTTQAPRPPGR